MTLGSLHAVVAKLATCIVVSLAMALALPSPAKAADGVATVVEYYNAALDHYFVTHLAGEIATLDAGIAIKGWARTGQSFNVYVAAAGNTSPVCRFYIPPANGDSHFFGRGTTECNDTAAKFPTFVNEDSQFFHVILPTAGVCPAGTIGVYRVFSNRPDANHRYMVDRAIRDQMVAARHWLAEGDGPDLIVMCVPPGATPTAVGVPSGSVTSATIGAAGGSVSAADGKLVVTIPAGALAANTTIGIQPVTNLAHGGIGAAYRLTPDGQVFAKPVTLAFAYAAQDIADTSADFLGAAFQTADGQWKWLGVPIVDSVARTVSVGSSHFTDISAVKGLQIRPAKKTVKPKATVDLQVKVCYVSSIGDDLSSLGFDCDIGQGFVGTIVIDEWSVNGSPGGGGPAGTVIGSGATATYTAPTVKPQQNPVAVSARVHNPKKGPGATTLVVSNITIADDSWTGTASGTSADGFFKVNVQVTWNLIGTEDNVGVYNPTAIATVTRTHPPAGGPGCAHPAPSSSALNPVTDGTLTIDFNKSPPTYYGVGTSSWPATIVCTAFSLPFFEGGPFFGGRGGPLGTAAAGAVGPDGVTIEGGAVDALGIVYQWKFTRD